MKTLNLTCIGCPLGCQLTVEMDGKEVVGVSGNTCKNGEKYAHKELTNPTRIVTSTVRVTGGTLPVVSVKTASDIPKGKINQCVTELKEVQIPAPVIIGQTIIADVAHTGISVIATKNIPKK